MKTLLVSINSRYIHSSLSVWYLKSAGKDFAEIEIIESTIKADKQVLLNNIYSKKPDLIAFSCYIWNINFIQELLPLLKKLCPNSRILLGGPEVSYNVSAVFAKHPEVDFIISGEGEKPFADLLKSISSDLEPKQIAGLSTKNTISPPYISKVDPPNPYTDEYFANLQGRISYIETSRGCPYSCSYCLSGRLGGVRFFDLDTVKNNIDSLSKSGTQTIKFVDRTFNCNEKRAIEIIEYILSKNPQYNGVCYHFEMAGDIISQKLIDTFKKAPAGLFQIEVGVQSFNEATLEAVNRKTDLLKVEKNMRQIIENGNIHVHMDLIAGLALEDFSSLKNSFNKLFSIKPHMLQLGFLKLLHGSPMEEHNVGVFSKIPPYEVEKTKWLNEKELATIKHIEDALDRIYNSGRFKMVVDEALKCDENLTPFDLFCQFGEKNIIPFGENLEKFSSRVLDFFSSLLGEIKTRDLMKENWLKVNSSGKLPLCLKENGTKYFVNKLDTFPAFKRVKSVKRATAVLNCTNELIFVDYKDKNPVTAEYCVQKINLEKILNNS